MIHVATACSSIPDKWRRQWEEAITGKKNLILFEPLIAEIFYRLALKIGETKANERILWLKSLPSTKIIEINNNLAIEAVKVYLKFRRYSLSLVDSFSAVIAKRRNAALFTTDTGIRNVCRRIGVSVSFLPKKALQL